MGFYKWFDKQDKAIRIVLLIPFWGWIFSFLYRLDKFIENKDVASLIGFILCIIPPFDFIMAIVDLCTELSEDKIKFLVSGGENFGINGTVDENNEDANKSDKSEKKTEESEEEK